MASSSDIKISARAGIVPARRVFHGVSDACARRMVTTARQTAEKSVESSSTVVNLSIPVEAFPLLAGDDPPGERRQDGAGRRARR